MFLPDYVMRCIDALEEAGFSAYAVGGCVRDSLLGRTPQDYDLCTSALPEQTEAVFCQHRLILAGKKHGTVGVITDGGVIEITTYRTEGEYRDNRHPEWVEFVPNVEADLARRDFTVNAMAYSPRRGFADPFGGREDLEKGILRCVGEPQQRFREDSLRILRGLRFAARFRLQIQHGAEPQGTQQPQAVLPESGLRVPHAAEHGGGIHDPIHVLRPGEARGHVGIVPIRPPFHDSGDLIRDILCPLILLGIQGRQFKGTRQGNALISGLFVQKTFDGFITPIVRDPLCVQLHQQFRTRPVKIAVSAETGVPAVTDDGTPGVFAL